MIHEAMTNKLVIPAILAVVSLVAVGFVVQPVERASAVHTTLLGNFFADETTTAQQVVIPISSKVKFGEACTTGVALNVKTVGTTSFSGAGNHTIAADSCAAIATTGVASAGTGAAAAAWRLQP